MGDQVRFTVFSNSRDQALAAVNAAGKRMDEVVSLDSEFARIAEAEPGARVRVSEEMIAVLRAGKRVSVLSDGAFDLTIGPASKLWKETAEVGTIPEGARLQDAMKRVGYQHLDIDPIFGYVRFHKGGMRLDGSGIVPGFASDEAMRVLKKTGHPRSLIETDHRVIAGEPPPNQKHWKVRLQDEAFTLANQALSLRDFRILARMGNREFSDVIDGRTGVASTNRHRVFVIGRQAVDTDPIAIALYVLGPEASPKFEKHFGVKAVFRDSTSEQASRSRDRRR
ncbi:MAG: FAD:protein FMN transferase [Fimbriimonadaceae bacterium]|nr:FAD:protein FMN transferase [Fimbriimonadaceae bacterium]